MKDIIFSLDDIKSGYVVELRSGRKFLVTRAGSFTKILADPRTGEWTYLSSQFKKDLTRRTDIKASVHEIKLGKKDDIENVYGLVQGTKSYPEVFSTATCCRKLIWSRIPPVRMTQEEIEAELGYRIEIVGDVNG